MIFVGKILDVKAYSDWVATNPDISGYKNYFEAYIAKFQDKQSRVSDYDENKIETDLV